jgi:hypothetical protein
LTLAELAKKFEVNPVMISRWKSELQSNMGSVFEKSGKAEEPDVDIQELYAQIGQLTLYYDYNFAQYSMLFFPAFISPNTVNGNIFTFPKAIHSIYSLLRVSPRLGILLKYLLVQRVLSDLLLNIFIIVAITNIQ